MPNDKIGGVIGVGKGEAERHLPSPPPAWKLSRQIWNISRQIWKCSGKPENDDFLFYLEITLILIIENTLRIWKYFVSNIRADCSHPTTPKLFCSPTAMIGVIWGRGLSSNKNCYFNIIRKMERMSVITSQ